MIKQSLNWKEILKKSDAKNISELAKKADIKNDLLYLAKSEKRSMSEKTRRAVLRVLASRFKTQNEMRAWLKEINWDQYVITSKVFQEDIEFISPHFLRQAKLPSTLTFPVYYVPRPKLEKQVIDAIFNRKEKSGQLSNKGLVISGIGGIGKSVLVNAALQQVVSDPRFQSSYPDGIFHLNLEDEKVKNAEQVIFNLAITLGMIDSPKHETPYVKTLLIREMKKLRGVFVLDGVKFAEEIEEFLAYIDTDTSFVVATTRLNISKAEQLRLFIKQFDMPMEFSIEESKSVILNITGTTIQSSDLETFRRIYQRVNGFPLAIVILAGLSSTVHLSWNTIEKALTDSTMKSLEVGEKTSKHESVCVTFGLSYQFLKHVSQSAANLFIKIGLFFTVEWNFECAATNIRL
jgi:hypothetical protein